MSKESTQHPTPPIETRTLIRVLVVVIIVLSFLTGYYHSLYTLEQKKYNRLEDMYVRVRMMIGREAMQQLIDESYELD
jgi:hypothetical protein